MNITIFITIFNLTLWYTDKVNTVGGWLRGFFEYFYPPWVISDFSLCSKEVVSDMLEFILVMLLLLVFIT